ncbi:MAG: hypothetical protein ACYSU2_16950, partial [Planctomycetota bacterium]
MTNCSATTATSSDQRIQRIQWRNGKSAAAASPKINPPNGVADAQAMTIHAAQVAPATASGLFQ